MSDQKIAFIFPGQGAQYPGMAQDFFEQFAIARETFEEADDLLGRKLSDIILKGPAEELTETKNSQTGIYVSCMSILRSIERTFPNLKAKMTAGLSLGEYTALTAAGKISFSDCLPLVQKRGQYMNDACEKYKGTMAVLLGLKNEQVQEMVAELKLPNDLWVANYNCPGQIVISGTIEGIERGVEAAKALGGKAMPLQVHGAFHSGLMKEAEERLKDPVFTAPILQSEIELVMNVTAKTGTDLREIRENLVKQVTHSVLWEQSIHEMARNGVQLFVEIGCGRTLSGFLKRMGLGIPFINVEKVKDLEQLANY